MDHQSELTMDAAKFRINCYKIFLRKWYFPTTYRLFALDNDADMSIVNEIKEWENEYIDDLVDILGIPRSDAMNYPMTPFGTVDGLPI